MLVVRDLFEWNQLIPTHTASPLPPDTTILRFYLANLELCAKVAMCADTDVTEGKGILRRKNALGRRICDVAH